MSRYEQGILRSLRRITRSIDLYRRQLAGRHGLTGPQLVCMRVLHEGGPITPSELARAVELSQATVTGIIDRLEAQALVSRARNVDDRRRVTVSLTDAGAALVAKAPPPLDARFLERLARLPDVHQARLLAALDEVATMMDIDAPGAVDEPGTPGRAAPPGPS